VERSIEIRFAFADGGRDRLADYSVESRYGRIRQKGVTVFDQQYTETLGRKRAVRDFSLVFRTISIPQMMQRLEHAGFRVRALLGDYKGNPWDPRADVWLILAEKG